MNKSEINYFVDLILLILFISVSFTGVILIFIYGPYLFLGLNKFIWLKIHRIVGLLFLFFGLIHFFMHFKWFSLMSKSFLKIIFENFLIIIIKNRSIFIFRNI